MILREGVRARGRSENDRDDRRQQIRVLIVDDRIERDPRDICGDEQRDESEERSVASEEMNESGDREHIRDRADVVRQNVEGEPELFAALRRRQIDSILLRGRMIDCALERRRTSPIYRRVTRRRDRQV